MFFRWGADLFDWGIVKRGGFILFVGLSFGFPHFSLKAQQSGPPLPEPTTDAIARAIEAERKRRAAELQNPLAQISIVRAQQIQNALREVNLKSQETRILIENNIESAQKATVEQAATFYEDIIRLDYAFRNYTTGKLQGLLDDPTNPTRIQAFALLDDILVPAREQYVKNRLAVAEAAQQRHAYGEARQILDMAVIIVPDSRELTEFRRFNEKMEARFRNTSPGTDVAARLNELLDRKKQINILLRDGKFLWEARDYNQAEDKFKRVTKLDPRNDVAYNYLRLIGRVRNDDAKLARDVNFRNMIQEVNDKWLPPEHQESMPVPNPEWMQRTRGSLGAPGGPAGLGANTGVIQKLQSIRIPEVAPLDGFSLNEVVTLLDEAARLHDHASVNPAEKGVNMMISTRLPETRMNVSVGGVGNMGNVGGEGFAPPQINLESGLPIQNRVIVEGSTSSQVTPQPNSSNRSALAGKNPSGTTLRRLDPSTIMVRGLTSTLRNLTLAQLLDNVADACDYPMRNTVRNGVVVFEYKPSDSEFVQRKFNVKPNTFWTRLAAFNSKTAGMESAMPPNFYGKAVNTEDKIYNAVAGGGGGGVINNTQAGEQIRQFLINQGINAAQVFFNPSNGQLLVRAPLADLDLIEQAIEILNTSPEQLYIEAKFAEIEFNDGESLGFDWYLGNSRMMGDKIISGAGPHPTFIGEPSKNNPSGFFPYPGTLQGDTFVPSPNSILPSPNEGHLTSSFKGYGNPLWTFTGIMTDPQFRMVINAISQQDGAELLSAPRILAISGQPANIAVVDVRNVVTAVIPSFQPGQAIGAGGGGTVQPVTQPENTGPSLNVLPYVNSDGYTIEMSLNPSIREFLGYEEAAFEAATFTSGGTVVTSPTPLPRIRTRDITVQCVVWDQTVLALGGLIAESVQTTRDKVPFLGDAPFIGRLFRGKGRNSKKKNMVIYVKPTIIDPAGNAKNRPAQLPFSRTLAPDQEELIDPDPAGGVPPGGGFNKFQNKP